MTPSLDEMVAEVLGAIGQESRVAEDTGCHAGLQSGISSTMHGWAGDLRALTQIKGRAISASLEPDAGT